MTFKGWKRRIFGPFQEKIKGGENLRFFLEIDDLFRGKHAF